MDYTGLTKVIDGELHFSTAMVLLLAMEPAHDADVPADGRQRGQASADELLAAARRHGFGGGDILLTLFAQGERSPRMAQMARDAMERIPAGEVTAALARAGFLSADTAPKKPTSSGPVHKPSCASCTSYDAELGCMNGVSIVEPATGEHRGVNSDDICHDFAPKLSIVPSKPSAAQ